MTITNPTTGINTTYDLTTGIPVNIDELIYLISPLDSPMINGINSDGLQILPSNSVDQTTFSWLDEEILLPRTTLAANVLTGAATILVATGTRIVFSTGDLLKVQIDGADSGEILQVTGYNATADTLDVDRAYGGTTAGPYTSADVVVGLGALLAEGSDPENARSADRTSRSNYTRIYGPTKIQMSRTEMGRRKYGVASEWSHQLMNRMRETTVAREQDLLYGVKFEDSATGIRSTGGLDYWITDNVDSSSTALNIAAVTAMQQACYLAGGVPDMLTANPLAFNDLNDISDNDRVRVTWDDPRRGRQPVMTVTTEFGTLTCVRNRWSFYNNAFMWTRSQLTRRVFDPVQYSMLAKTGDGESAQIVCEEGVEAKGMVHAAKFSALAYTA